MSLTGITSYLRPGTLEEALSLLSDRAIAVGGGTDVIRHPHTGVDTLVDLGALPLRYIRQDRGFAVGATATLTDMLEHPGLAPHLDGVISGMLRGVGSPLLRNAATIGGHLARGRYSDVVPVLLALDATITLFDGSEQIMPLAAYYAEGRRRARALITEVGIPAAGADTAAAFLKFTRTSFDFALLNCAARVRLADGKVAECRIAVGETPALAAVVDEAARHLLDGPLDDDRLDQAAAIAAEGIPAQDDQRASAGYRRALCRVGVRRCLEEVRHRFAERRP